MSEQVYDLIVVGAGPAGMRAATVATELGLNTILVDEQPGPGGQIYCAITTTPLRRREVLGDDYWHGADLVAAMRSVGVVYQPRSTVWGVMPLHEEGVGITTFDVAISRSGSSQLMRSAHLILATGAQERPFPISGWTLPGVVTAGAAQVLLKSAGLAPSGHTIIAGSGPLLYVVVAQLMKAGAKVDRVLDTTPQGRWRSALPKLAAFAASPYLRKGLRLLTYVRLHAHIVEGVEMLEACGSDHLQSVRYRVGDRREEVCADELLLHQGVIPSISLSSAIGCAHRWDDGQACFVPQVDAWGASSLRGITIAGDGAAIGGARVAQAQGAIAAFNAAHALGRMTAEQRYRASRAARKERALWERGRAFIDAMYLPSPQFRVAQGETIVCRCEEVSAQSVVDAIRLGCHGPNQLKSYLRCGMGPCQGRYCGLTVTELFARERGISPSQVGYYRLRFPIKPIALGEIADMPQTETSTQAVVRI
jgi:NADPH-dependent 2,4-dienoyl-CoA reductase/sulfur reductase-like enzyme